MSREMIPQYDTKIFTDIFDDAGTFVFYYQHSGIPTTISTASATTLYYLLYARYANSPIANYDEEQFKYKVFSIVFQYGPTWEKKLSIQQTLRGLSLNDLIDDGQLSELFSHEGENGLTESTSGSASRTTEQDVTGTDDSTTTTDRDTTSTGTQGVTHTGTSTAASTGTQAVAHTGTVSTDHDNTVTTDNETEDIKNHAYNPGTSPAVNAYSPLTYINQQDANKNVLDGQSVQDESNVTTYANTDTTTNNLTNTTTNNLTDTTTNNLAGTDDSEVTVDRDTTTHTEGSESNTTTGSKTVSGTDSTSDTRTRTAKKGQLKAYAELLELLETDVTGEFISKFKVCFKQFVLPERHWIYVTDVDDDEIVGDDE